MAITNIKDLFLEELRDVYHAEKQLTKALPKMARAAASDELKQAFVTHLDETKGHVERLEQVFESLDVAKRAKRCEAMAGLVEEGQEIIDEVEDRHVRDVGLITAAQKVEHYEIASYGSLVALAKALGHKEAASLLAETLAEEKATDEKLTMIAANVNPAAMEKRAA